MDMVMDSSQSIGSQYVSSPAYSDFYAEAKNSDNIASSKKKSLPRINFGSALRDLVGGSGRFFGSKQSASSPSDDSDFPPELLRLSQTQSEIVTKKAAKSFRRSLQSPLDFMKNSKYATRRRTSSAGEAELMKAIKEASLNNDGIVGNLAPANSEVSDAMLSHLPRSKAKKGLKRSQILKSGSQFFKASNTDNGSSKSSHAYVDIEKLNTQLEAASGFHYVHRGLDSIEWETLSRSELKLICRSGLKQSIRRKVWLMITETEEFIKREPDLFESTRNEVFGEKSVSDLPVIPLLGHSSNFEYHYLLPCGVKALHENLCMLAYINPDLDYCPFIVDMIAVSLTYMDQKEAFYMAQKLIGASRTGQWYFPLTGKHFLIVVTTFKKLVEWKLEELSNHLKKIGAVEAMTGIIKDWFARGFVSHLPRYSLLRTLDTFLLEGSKIHYRVGLGILKLHEKDLMLTKNSTEFIGLLGHLSENNHDGQLLLQYSFGFSFSRKDLVQLQESVQEEVAELAIPVAPKVPISWPDFDESSSAIISVAQCCRLWTWLPNRCHLGNLHRIFSTSECGYNMATFCDKIVDHGPIIILIKDNHENVFGTFISDSIVCNGKPVVDRLAFVFSFPVHGSPSNYNWIEDEEDNDVFYTCSKNYFAMSGSGKTVLYMEKTLLEGSTSESAAYGNPPLSDAVGGCFAIKTIEVWAFDHLDPKMDE